MSRTMNTVFPEETINAVRQSMVANPEHLKETLDVVFDDAEYNSAQYLYRTMFWLAFMGFEIQDIVELRTEHIDWETLRIIYTRPNRHLIWGLIPAEAVQDIHKACDLESMLVSYRCSSRRYKRADGDKIVRGRQSMDFKDESERTSYIRRVVRPMISKSFKDTELRFIEKIGGVPEWISINLTIDRTIKSGVFYRFFERERAGLETNLKNIYQAHYARPEDNDWDFARFDYEYQRQYLIWKSAFTRSNNGRRNYNEMVSD